MMPVDEASPEAVIFDVDGTLCDVRGIRRFVEAPPGVGGFKADFDRFHSESINCPPYRAVVDLARRFHYAGVAVLIVTGREEKWSFLTLTWLAENGVEFDELYMRPSRDYRADAVIKAEFERDIANRYKARLAIDDRPDTIEVWRGAGMATAQVAEDGRVLPVEWPHGRPAEPRLAQLFAGR